MAPDGLVEIGSTLANDLAAIIVHVGAGVVSVGVQHRVLPHAGGPGRPDGDKEKEDDREHARAVVHGALDPTVKVQPRWQLGLPGGLRLAGSLGPGGLSLPGEVGLRQLGALFAEKRSGDAALLLLPSSTW